MDEKNILYITSKGKQRFGRKTYNWDELDKNGDYGRIVPSGYVVFDFDKQPYIDIITKILTESKYRCKMLTTTKGVHFMFRTNFAKVSDTIGTFNWLGLHHDTKGCGTKETKQSYQAIKVDGVIREEKLINCPDDQEDMWDLDVAPKWMYTVSNKKNDQLDLTQDQTGGRNNLFHSVLMIKAKNAGFSYDEYVEMAHSINNYVLPEPLSEDELNTAIRQEEWDNLEIGEDKQTLETMAQDLINYWGCKLCDGDLFFYDEQSDRYTNNFYLLKGYLQKKYGSQNITTNKMEEVFDQVDILLHNNSDYKVNKDSEYVLCGKHLVSFLKDNDDPNAVIDNTRTIFTDIHYPYEIMSEEEFYSFNGRMKQFIDEISCGNETLKTIMWECVGCMLAPIKPFFQMFVWYGSGANGKSVLLELVSDIMRENMSFANILQVNEQFALQSMLGKICNVTDDVGITTLTETGTLKSLIQGSSIEVNRKFKDSVWWKPNIQLVICCNELPKIQDTTQGMIRRLTFVPFDLQLQEGQLDRLLAYKLKSDENEMRYLMTGAIFAFREAIKRDGLTTFEKQKELKKDFMEENSEPYKLFYDYLVDECGDGSKEQFSKWLVGKTYEEMYSRFDIWALNGGYQLGNITQRMFTRGFNKYLPSNISSRIVSLGGVKIRSYCWLEDTLTSKKVAKAKQKRKTTRLPK